MPGQLAVCVVRPDRRVSRTLPGPSYGCQGRVLCSRHRSAARLRTPPSRCYTGDPDLPWHARRMEADPLGHSLIHHFAQANPKVPGQDDVPALLRRVAVTLEGITGVEVMDLVLHNEINEAATGTA